MNFKSNFVIISKHLVNFNFKDKLEKNLTKLLKKKKKKKNPDKTLINFYS